MCTKHVSTKANFTDTGESGPLGKTEKALLPKKKRSKRGAHDREAHECRRRTQCHDSHAKRMPKWDMKVEREFEAKNPGPPKKLSLFAEALKRGPNNTRPSTSNKKQALAAEDEDGCRRKLNIGVAVGSQTIQIHIDKKDVEQDAKAWEHLKATQPKATR